MNTTVRMTEPLQQSDSPRQNVRAAGWGGPLVMTFLMTGLAAVTSLGLLGAFAAMGHPNPGEATMTWINVWNSLLYLPLLLALLFFLRREGTPLRAVVGLSQGRWGRDIRIGLGLFVALFALDAILEFSTLRLISHFFGDPFAGLHFAEMTAPPLLSIFFGLLILPFGAGIVEELVYRGYVIPRLTANVGPWLAVLISGFGFGLQHIALGMTGDWRYALSRGIALTLVGIVFGLIYRRQGRLLPLIVCHVVWDIVGIGFLTGLLPLLLRG